MKSTLYSRSAQTGVLPFRFIRLVFLPLTMLSLTARGDETIAVRSQDVISAIDKAQEDREQMLSGYSATERYTVRNSHFNQAAEVTATVVFQKGLGKIYTILSRSGPGVLQEHVIGRILKEDATLSRSAERPHNLLTSANYSMQVDGIRSLQGTACYVVKILPRVHHFSLIEGEAWFDVKDFSLLRIEGKPAASPSFWTGKPTIEREYIVVNGLSFPQHSRATSKGFISGKSELTIDYSQYVILK